MLSKDINSTSILSSSNVLKAALFLDFFRGQPLLGINARR
jgi:hypothetical protein